MAQFKDTQDRTWDIVVTITTISRVRDTLGVDFLSAPDVIGNVKDDIMLLCNVLYVICQDQANRINVSDKQFGEGLAGDVIEHATEALIAALIDFFPTRRRELLRAVNEKSKIVAMKAMDMAEQRIAAMDPEELAKKIMGDSGKTSMV